MLWSGWRVTLYKESNGPFDLRSSNTREYSETESHPASHEGVCPSHARMSSSLSLAHYSTCSDVPYRYYSQCRSPYSLQYDNKYVVRTVSTTYH